MKSTNRTNDWTDLRFELAATLGRLFLLLHSQAREQGVAAGALPGFVERKDINALDHFRLVRAIDQRGFLGDQILFVGFDEGLFKSVPAGDVARLLRVLAGLTREEAP